MDEDLAIINTNTRNEKIKNFFKNYKKTLIIFVSIIILIILSFFGYKEFQNKKKINISNLFNSTIISYSNENKDQTKDLLIEIINKNDPTYSPLALYFIIDNNLIKEKEKVNKLFNILIDKTPLEKEIRNLIIYKKALFNADHVKENELIKILSPILNSKSIWKSHGLYLIAEFLYSKNEKIKAKEFYSKIIDLKNSNEDLRKEAQKRLNRDLSD